MVERGEDHRGAPAGDGAAPVTPHVALVGDVALIDDRGVRHPVRGKQPQLVLALLALEGRRVDREELAELLWGEPLPTHWAGAVRGVLTKVRAALDAGGLGARCLVASRGLVQLELPEPWTVDVVLAERTVGAARRQLAEGLTSAALDQATAAERLLHAGPFLHHGDGAWVRRQRERLVGLQRQAGALAVEALLSSGESQPAAARAAERLVADPFDERLHHLRIEALLAGGQPSAADAAYEELAALLRRELGVAPAADTAALVATIAPATDRAIAAPASRAAPTELDLAARVARPPRWVPASGRFVGRQHELGDLEHAFDRVVETGATELVVVGGHAGSGKTRLAAELGVARLRSGVQALWSRCHPASGVAFEPVVEALASIVDTDPDLISRLGPEGDGLSLVLPELRAGGSRPLDDSSVARAQVHRSVVATFDEWCARPTLWIIDDLQWASADTLMLVELLLGGVARPLLVVATCRGTTPSVDAHLARVQRLVPTHTIELGGLTADDVRELVAGVAVPSGRTLDDIATELHERTGGHPFLVAQIVDEASRTGRPLDPSDLPKAVKDWLARRVGELPADVAATLQLASVAGMEVDLDLLDRCSTDPLPEVLDRCERLVAAGLLVEDADVVGRFRFPHAITREVVLAGLGPSRRALLDRTVGDALREMHPVPGRHRSLATHYHRAGPGFLALALEHQIEAGWEALDHASLGLAVELFDSAIGSARSAGELPGQATLLVRALVGAGHAHLRSGDRVTAEQGLTEAVERARATGLAVELAEAVLGLVGRAGRGAGESLDDHAQATLIREALAALDQADEPGRFASNRESLRLRLEGELALALLLTDAVDERESLVLRAVERVRAEPDPAPGDLARALLNARIALLDPEQAEQRLADLDEVLALPVTQLSPEQTIAALTYRHEELLRLGRRSEADAALERAAQLADHHRHPYWQWAVRTWRGLGRMIDGDLGEAEALARAAADLHADVPEESMACLQVNLVMLRVLQRRAGEVVDVVAAAAELYPQIPCYRAVLALCLAESGDVARAERAYRFFADQRFANVPRDTNRFLALDVLAHVAVDLGDRDGGAELASRLAPYRGLHVVLNCYGGGGAYWGPATHALARLAALEGDEEGASSLFLESEVEAKAIGADHFAELIRADARMAAPAGR